jgi:macrocin-O-methyltransferase TylF-like protien
VSRIAKLFFDRVVIPPVRKVPLLRRAANYVTRAVSDEGYYEQSRRFVANGSSGKWSCDVRREVLRRFEEIDRLVPIGSTPTEGLAMAEAMLSMQIPGDVVECGCFSGGSTAKLSIVAKLTGRKLSVFDSFEGLPEVDDFNKKDFNARMGAEWVTEWTAGRYAARLDLVKANVSRFGEISVCSFHKGWFSDTIKPEVLPAAIAMVFVDVDIPLSARQCFEPLWPRLSSLGVFFLHDIGFIKLLQTILDEKLWTEQFKQFPPILFGAGYGLGDDAPYLGFMVKEPGVTAEYINSLTINK